MTSSIPAGYLSFNFNKFILKMIVDLLTPNFFTIWINFSFSLNLLNTSPYWYAVRMFVFFVRIISSYSLIIAAASSKFSTLLVTSSKLADSIFSLAINGLINCSLISSLFNLLFGSTRFAFPNYDKKTVMDCKLNLPKHCFF